LDDCARGFSWGANDWDGVGFAKLIWNIRRDLIKHWMM
jgi:hypothetical protein